MIHEARRKPECPRSNHERPRRIFRDGELEQLQWLLSGKILEVAVVAGGRKVFRAIVIVKGRVFVVMLTYEYSSGTVHLPAAWLWWAAAVVVVVVTVR